MKLPLVAPDALWRVVDLAARGFSVVVVDTLPLVSEQQMEFNEDVVEVNRGLAAAYRAHRDGIEDASVTRGPLRAPLKPYAVRF